MVAMTKPGSSRPRPLTLRLLPRRITLTFFEEVSFWTT
ncbi:Hypothetical protein LOCK908_0537 [Lacticaseibacillus rhamnosus LOCK908]|nr:Hypothetical protein LOCK908_0537 [Lacticaseibacillus rhamnosus LOCK908]